MSKRNTVITTAAGLPRGGAASTAMPAATFDDLDRLLQGLIAEHESLLKLAGDHRRAIGAADVPAMAACLDVQAATLERIHGLELERQRLVRTLGGALGRGGVNASGGATPGTVRAIVSTATEPVRTRLMNLADRLRDLLQRIHQEHEAIRIAAETLGSHMQGLMRQLCRHMSHAGTYGRRAVIETHAPVLSTLDMRS